MNIDFKQEERWRLTLEALDDVNNGNVIDHRSIQDWVESLGTETPLAPPYQ